MNYSCLSHASINERLSRLINKKRVYCVNFTQNIWKFEIKVLSLRKIYTTNRKYESNRTQQVISHL